MYEHPEWFVPLFAELERRGLPYEGVRADELDFSPAERISRYALVFNRMSPSAYLRGHLRAIFAAQHYLAHVEQLGVHTLNGSGAYTLELSKSRQLDLLARLELPAPSTRVVNHSLGFEAAARQLEFPLIIKPNVGGSGARMRQFSSPAELHEAVDGGELEDVFEIDGTALVQEYHPPREGGIVRVEMLDGKFLYAIRIYNDPALGFNLCPADICQAPDADLDFCPADASAKPARKIEAITPSAWVVESVLRIGRAGGLDICGVEYLESERDGQVYFYDINALSNFVTDAPSLVGFDPFVRLGDLVERRWREAYARAPGQGEKTLSGLSTARSPG
jgi:hypothetical protein